MKRSEAYVTAVDILYDDRVLFVNGPASTPG
ncbi:hypothetical protein RUMTOR_02892, partial [[Ruminococcus] torques ATCC 27756]